MLKKSAQNLIEFVLVFPLLVVMIFAIVELSFFWKTVNNVQNIALQAASAASTSFVSDSETSNTISDVTYNNAVKRALSIVTSRSQSLGVSNPVFSPTPLAPEFGEKPYAMYELVTSDTKPTTDGNVPVLRLNVDYRQPLKDGVIVQLSYCYSTLFLGAEFTLPGGTKVTIIPKNMLISSTKIRQYINN